MNALQRNDMAVDAVLSNDRQFYDRQASKSARLPRIQAIRMLVRSGRQLAPMA